MQLATCLSSNTSPPLAPGVHFWDIPPVIHLYPACISPNVSLVIPCIPCINPYLAILQQKQIPCIPLFSTVSSCIRTYLAVSSCIPLYLTISHHLGNGIWPKIHSKEGLSQLLRTSHLPQSSTHRRALPRMAVLIRMADAPRIDSPGFADPLNPPKLQAGVSSCSKG